MRVFICGGTGFIGTSVGSALQERGDEFWIVTRHKPAANAAGFRYVTWEEWEANPDAVQIDAIVNLTGESINQRWTASAKERIVSSRTKTADRIAGIVSRMQSSPSVLVNASGISLYGHSFSSGNRGEPIREELLFDESSPAKPADFLGETVVKWEAAADHVPVDRVVKLRIGLVLGRGGGAFPLLRLPHLLFGGGRIGSGKQGMPWIHIEDMTALVLFCLAHPSISGPVNAVGPEPVDNDTFGRILARSLHRPHWFPVPGALLRGILGEMSCLVLTGQLAAPRKALDHGFKFRYARLEDALNNLA